MEGIETKQDYQELLKRYIDIFWRRRIWVLIPSVVGIVIAGALLFYLPKIYRSTTLILVEAQKVPEEYVRSAVTGTVEGRLSTIQQQILSRSLLQKIIDRFGLYRSEEEPDKIAGEEIFDRMRKNIEVRTVGSRSVDAFSISFTGKDPETVMKVTNELASLFIEENLKIREQFVEGTTEFLDNELKNLKEILERQENKIGEFKRTYMGRLPEQLEANLRALDRFQAELLSNQAARKAIQDRLLTLEKTYLEAKQDMDEVVQLLTEASNLAQDVRISNLPSSSSSSTSALELKLLQRKKEMADLVAEYKENYPDVIMLKREIQGLEDRIAGEKQQREFKPPVREESIPPRPAERRVLKPILGFEKDLPIVADLQRQIQAGKADLRRSEDREKEIQEQIRAYQIRVEGVPELEQEAATLWRDYENSKKNYQVLLDKKLNAKISENLEKRQKGEQFRILDSANLPEKPIQPDPFRIIFIGLVVGLTGGLGLAFVREQLDNSMRTPEELEKATLIPVLASIPDFNEKGREAAHQRRIAAVGTEKSNGEDDGI